jgi:hypothetical protein
MSVVILDSGGARPSPVNQGPLPPLDTTGNPVLTLPGNSPFANGPIAAPNKRIWIESAWTMRIKNLPYLPGATSISNPTSCLTWFVGCAAWAPYVDAILTYAAQKGMTHFTLSAPDLRDYGGLSDAQIVAIASYIKSWGFVVHIKWWAKLSNTVWSCPQNSDWPTMQTWIGPLLSLLMEAGAMDACSPWEWNANNIAGPQGTDILDGVAQMVIPAGVDPWLHFTSGEVWWDAPTSNRDAFWQARRATGHVGIHYQADQSWDSGTRQARYQDSTNHAPFVATGAQFVAWEDKGSQQFDTGIPDEPTTAMYGYVDLCTPGLMPVTGSGGGPWFPNGQTLLAA